MTLALPRRTNKPTAYEEMTKRHPMRTPSILLTRQLFWYRGSTPYCTSHQNGRISHSLTASLLMLMRNRLLHTWLHTCYNGNYMACSAVLINLFHMHLLCYCAILIRPWKKILHTGIDLRRWNSTYTAIVVAAHDSIRHAHVMHNQTSWVYVAYFVQQASKKRHNHHLKATWRTPKAHTRIFFPAVTCQEAV